VNWTYHDRHWMHIWKVGYTPCTNCIRDSRVIASLSDSSGEIMEQRFYCEHHAPWKGNSGRWTSHPADPISSINLELGATLSVDLPAEEDYGSRWSTPVQSP
jgi:hypothetical protein